MEKILNFILELKSKGLLIDVQNDQVKVKGNVSSLTSEEIDFIKKFKQEIIGFFNAVKDTDERNANFAIDPVKENYRYVLSSSQLRMWILSQLGELSLAYNISGAYEFSGDLDIACFTQCLYDLLNRHEILRTVFEEDESGIVYQRIINRNDLGFVLSYHDLRDSSDSSGMMNTLLKKQVTTPFSLSEGPLISALLAQTTADKFIFSYVIHHIISDGWSMGVLIKELIALYMARKNGTPDPLPALRIQYKDFADWQQKQLSGSHLLKHRQYWLKQFEGELPLLEMPVDRPRPSVQSFKGGVMSRMFSADVSYGIKNLGLKHSGSLFMTLLSGINTLLYKYTGQTDIIIGSPKSIWRDIGNRKIR
ncbi:MAG: hypothetical protein IAF38_19995, partial [Bacteroidia bacterium]|nr:hypothetical protein [Bacteroidia bacterium]